MSELKKFKGAERLFTYKVAHDGGSAPNPYNGVCTLAICKPVIRRVAKVGDVIVGLGHGVDERRLVYCMVVEENPIEWADYIQKCKCGMLPKEKVPRNDKDPGDCIWEHADPNKQQKVRASWSGHIEDDYETDVRNGKRVIFSTTYWYFGCGDKFKFELPYDLVNIIPGRGHRSNGNNNFRDRFVEFFNQRLDELKISKLGIMGTPEHNAPDQLNKNSFARC
ncbi:MAG: hypothetical protein WCH01_13620 [Methylococcaceae bacterium]